MDEQWFCINCDLVTRLDTHLRCEFCGSDAVAVAAPTRWDAEDQALAEIRKLARNAVEFEKLIRGDK
jgi:hypothetical protein